MAAALKGWAPPDVCGVTTTVESLEPDLLRAGWKQEEDKQRPRRLLVVDGERPWRMVEIDRQRLTIGRHASCDIVLRSEDISRYHAAIQRTSDGLVVEDLGSTNGTFVNCLPVQRSALERGSVVFIGSAMLKVTAPSSADDIFYETLYEASRRDPLTHLANRQPLMEQLRELIDQAPGPDGGLVMVDVDSFKRINDTRGHVVGDQVLRHVAQTLRTHTRAGDLVARYGGDEFAVVARHGDEADLRRLADKLRDAVAGCPARTRDGTVEVTVTTGHAMCRPEMKDPNELVQAADQRLIGAKNGHTAG